jgi:tetratricopeptide (TPR) repeat protein
MRHIALTLFFLFASAFTAEAQDSFETLSLEVKFLESNPELAPSPQIVTCDTILLIKGHAIEAFSGNLSLEIEYIGTSDSLAEMNITQISLPPYGKTRVEKIRSPLQVPYIVDSALVKENSVYRALFTALKYDSVTVTCEYDHAREDDFYFDPSGDFDLYFVPNSLGDFHWNKIRDYLEYELDNFYKVFNFTQPGKSNYFLYPCPTPFYADYRGNDFGIHPAKNKVLQQYSHVTSHIPIEAINLVKLYRYWGYSPRVLAEGAAGIVDFHKFYCRNYKNEEGLYPLEKMLITAEYDSLPDHHKARMQAVSFVSYLINIIGFDRFRQLYIKTTDLNLENDLREFTSKSIAELEKDWHKFVDTVSYPKGMFHYYAQREMGQRNITEAIYLYETALESDPSDSAYLKYLFTTYYTAGYYSKAAESLRKILALYSGDNYYLPLANMSLASGQTDSALFYYDLAEKADSSNEIIPYKLGQTAFYQGDYESAGKYFRKLTRDAQSIPLRIDAHLYLGLMDRFENRPEAADSHFIKSLNNAKRLISQYPDNPLYNLRAGEAALHLNELEVAKEYLSLAEFTELRPYYLGRVLLAFGKLHDLENSRETAKQYYQRVLDIPSSFQDKSEAEKYLAKPYTS